MKSGIYKILNVANNKLYIGSAIYLNSRLRTHKANLNNNKHPNKYLQAAYNKYGANNFKFIILEYCDKEKLIAKEQAWLNWTKCYDREIGYNLRKNAENNLGIKFGLQSKEHIEKRVNKIKGIKRTEQAILNMSLCRIGKKLSEEHKQNVSDGGLGRIASQNTKDKIGKANSKPNKWPCPDKYYCKCRNCLNKKNQDRKRSKVFIFISGKENVDYKQID